MKGPLACTFSKARESTRRVNDHPPWLRPVRGLARCGLRQFLEVFVETESRIETMSHLNAADYTPTRERIRRLGRRCTKVIHAHYPGYRAKCDA